MIPLKGGVTSQSIYVEILDSTSTTGARKTGLAYNTASLTAYYVRQGGSAVSITLATLAAANSAWSSGGFKEVDATNMPGVYRLDIPDAAIASGVKSVVVTLKGATGMVQVSKEIRLVAYDPDDTVRLGLTALPNAAAEAAGGLYTRGTGAGQINQPANGLIDVNTLRWNGTAVATPATAGIPDVNVKNMNNVAATSITTINANQGTTQPVNYTGTGASALVKSDMVDVAGAAVSTSSAQIGVNVIQAAGTAWGSGAITAGAIANDAITAAKIAADAIGASELAADAVAEIQSGLSTYAGGDTSGVTTLLSRLSATRAGYLDNLSVGAVATASKLTKYVQLILRKDSAIATDNSAEVTEINANGGSGAGSFANSTDSQEALRDRGDAAWVTATGFSTLDAAGVRSAVGLGTANLDTQLDALPTAAENATAVWGAGTRVLTAGTNIALAKGTGVTGFNDLSAAQVNSEVDTALADYDAPTKTEMDSAFAALNDLSATDVENAVWNADITTHSTTDSAGEALQNAGAAGTPPTASEIADQVWDEILSGHAVSGSTGEALGAAGGAGDPWITALPGAYSLGQAGYILGTNLNATVGSRASQTSVDAIQSDTNDIQTRLPAALTGAGNMKVDVLALSGDTTAADNAESFFDGTGYNGTNNVIPTVTNLTNAPSNGDFTSTMKTSLNNATPVVTVSDKTGFSLSSGGVQAIWDALTSALTTSGSIGKWIVDKLDVVVSTRLASSSYTAPPTAVQNRQEMDSNSTKLANLDATVSSRSTVTTAQVNAEIVDALSTDTYAEPSSVPAANASIVAKLGWLFTLGRNKITQTDSTQTVYADNGSTPIATATVSDDGTTATRNKMS